MKKLILALFGLGLLSFFSCHPEPPIDPPFAGHTCDGKQVLDFSTMSEFTNEYYTLYTSFMNSDEDEQVLRDYEDDHQFSSLRKKENDMDDGLIAEDPNFDETVFTTDDVLSTFLNEDGMVVIEGRLYVWDDGCVIFSIPFSCSNYNKLLDFYTAIKVGNITDAYTLFYNNDIQIVNKCQNQLFDFETIAENGGRVDKTPQNQLKSSGCGYQVFLNKETVSCNTDGTRTYKVSFDAISPPGNQALSLFYFKSLNNDYTGIEFYETPGGVVIPTGTQDSLGYPILTATGEFYFEAPLNNNILTISLVSTINPFTGNSCMASDKLEFNLNCPFSISANIVNTTPTEVEVLFTVDGYCPGVPAVVNWSFGDGTSATGGLSIQHTYPMPCMEKEYDVCIDIPSEPCLAGKRVCTRFKIENPCNRRNYKFITHEDNVNGKKMKLISKIKSRPWPFSGTKIVHKFKWRVQGDKTISSTGTIASLPSNSSLSCIVNQIQNIMPTQTKSGKKRNKQKETSSTIYMISADNPYQVHFQHSNGFQHTLLSSDLQCSE